jgi:DmsE family decaheme c-type cytochrome
VRALSLTVLFLAMRAAWGQQPTNSVPADTITRAAGRNAPCLGCHAPIAAQLKEKVVHQALEMGCGACHIDHLAGGAKSKTAHFINAASVSELCEGCHVQFKKRFEEAQVQHTALQLDDDSCITCHRPHASQEPSLLKAKVINLCITCHTDKPGNKRFVHDPAGTNCAICHDPHGSNFQVHLRADVNTLCTACHGPIPPTQNSEGERLMMPAGFPERATKIYVDSTNHGHPTLSCHGKK